MNDTNVITQGQYKTLHVFGPTVAFLTPPSDTDNDYCIMHGTIPPGVSVPVHSHPDDESFYILSGTVQVLSQIRNDLLWREMMPGDFIHVPANMKHAWMNAGEKPVEGLITTTARLGRFFQEIGKTFSAGQPILPPTQTDIQHFMEVAARYNHWLGTDEENAALGISILPEIK